MNQTFARTQPAAKKRQRDFLTSEDVPETHWIITNPPWSLLMEFLLQAMKKARHIVFLTHCNAWFTVARLRALAEQSFAIREIAYVDRPESWKSMGLQIAAVYIAHDEEPDRWSGKTWDGKTIIGPLPV